MKVKQVGALLDRLRAERKTLACIKRDQCAALIPSLHEIKLRPGHSLHHVIFHHQPIGTNSEVRGNGPVLTTWIGKTHRV